MTDRQLMVLVDGHSLLYRAFHGVPETLANRQGEQTNAVFGFTNMLLNVMRDWKPCYLVVALDVGRSFRHDIAPEYKATRERMPDSLRAQVERARQVVAALGVPAVGIDGWEGDDILGTVSRLAEEAGVEVLIVTGDTDALQLVDDHVRVLTSGRRFSDQIVYDRERVVERYGLQPEQLIDYKALVGDKSDNVAGVRGVGDKSATQLLQRYGSVDGIYEQLDEVEPARIKTALTEGREAARLSRELVTIRRDVPLEIDLERCRTSQPNLEELSALFRELDFRTLVGRVPGLAEAAAAADAGQAQLFAAASPAAPVSDEEGLDAPAPQSAGITWEVVATTETLEALLPELAEAEWLAVDVETDSVAPVQANLVGISLATSPDRGYYLPIAHEGGPNLPLADAVRLLGPVLATPKPLKVAHNSKFDWMVLERHGFAPGLPDFDTMVAEWILNPEARSLGLKATAWARLGLDMTPITDLIGTGRNQLTMDKVVVNAAAAYAAADAAATLGLRPVQAEQLDELAQADLLHNLEMPLVPVLADMELAGVRIDVEYLRRYSAELGERLGEITEGIQRFAGYDLNINSSQQLSELLFGQLRLPTQGLRKTATGFYSTAAEVLEGLRGEHEVIDLLLEYRQLAKLRSTYAESLPALVNPETGRVHTSFNQTATSTGRLSSSDPNLQNIPIRTELGRQIRRAFVAEPGSVLVSADYSQVELRILAHVAQDPLMLEAFSRRQDIHAATASLTYGVPIDEVTSDMRRVAKTVNFAVIYGVSAFGLARQSDLTQEEARVFIDAYFRTYPKVKEYLDGLRRMANEKGYVQTLLGRRRYFPQLVGTERVSRVMRGEAERAAINAPIQGTAADIIKIAMIRLHAALRERGMASRLILQVHDELVVEAPEAEAEAAEALVREVMEGAYPLDVPLSVEVGVGANWLTAK